MLSSWRSALRVVALPPRTQQPRIAAQARVTTRWCPIVQSRSFSVQHKTHDDAFSPTDTAVHPATTDASPLFVPTPQTPIQNREHREPLSPFSIHKSRLVLAAPESSYGEALHAFEYLRDHRTRLHERDYRLLMEKANIEEHYSTVLAHFTQFCDALDANEIVLYQSPKSPWSSYHPDRLQIHRHVLWAILQGCPANRRFRKMQRHFRKYELATKLNRLQLYEADSLNFLLRMECTFPFVDPLARDQGNMSSFTRVQTILNELRLLRFHTDYSSCHALFRFLMHCPDAVLGEFTSHISSVQDRHARTKSNQAKMMQDEVTEEETAEDHEDHQASAGERAAQAESTEDETRPLATATAVEHGKERVLFNLLNALFDAYPRVVERDSRRVSMVVSTAASAGHVGLAVELLRDADARGMDVDAASFAHVAAMAADEETRLAIADLYTRAKDQDHLFDDPDHVLKRNLLHYAVQDGNFTQILELLHEMEYSNTAAQSRTVAILFARIAKHRLQIRYNNRLEGKSRLEQALKKCPTVLELLTSFPTAIGHDTFTSTHGVFQALRAGDIDVALEVLRTAVNHAEVPLEPEVFSQVLYAVLVTNASHSRDVMAAREVEQLFDAVHPGKRDLLNAQLLNLCESNKDLETMVAVLDNWHADASAPLSKRALQRVFDVISFHLGAIRKQDKGAEAEAALPAQGEEGEDEEEEDEANARYKIGNLELSFCGVLENYPVLVPLTASTLGNALMRSATMQLVNDVATLLHVAHSQGFAIKPVVYKAALGVLHESSKTQDPTSPVHEALQDSIYAMKMNGLWEILTQRFPEFTAKLQDEQ